MEGDSMPTLVQVTKEKEIWENIIDVPIFADFLLSAEIQCDINALQQAAFKWKSEQQSHSRSNKGGWQSDFILSRDTQQQEFLKLFDNVNAFVQYAIKSKFNATIEEDYTGWWCNINRLNSYNILHHHQRADVVGVFYVKSDPDASSLQLLRNDGSGYGSLYDNMVIDGKNKDATIVNVTPIEGRLYLFPGHLWHHVNTQEVDRERISVSYNFFVTNSIQEAVHRRYPNGQ